MDYPLTHRRNMGVFYMASENKLWNKERCEILQNWWESLDQDRGERAKLRRCKTEFEVCFQPAYIHLCQKLPAFSREKLASIAGLLAHVKTLSEQKIASQMSATKKSDQPIVSEIRFRRLIACETLAELYPFMRRALPLLDNKLNIKDLAISLYFWNDQTRKRWVYDYYFNI